MKKTLFVLLLTVLFATFALAETVITLAAGAVGQELELAKDAAAKYMEMHPDVTVKVLETPDLSTDRLGLYLQFFEAESPEVDVYMIDVIWPGDLAAHLVDLYQYDGMKELVDT
ncbi:MAG: hypothetical protein ACE5R7_07380, partial [Nitrosarchaeum sp.]